MYGSMALATPYNNNIPLQSFFARMRYIMRARTLFHCVIGSSDLSAHKRGWAPLDQHEELQKAADSKMAAKHQQLAENSSAPNLSGRVMKYGNEFSTD